MATPPPPANCTSSNFWDILRCTSGQALNSGATTQTLVSAIGVSAASFAAQMLVFALLRLRLTRIYRPRTYLVPEKERVVPPPAGLFGWIKPLFTTGNLTIIQKCGLDAYFFLRYLRLLLKVFFPMAIILLAVLLPINATASGGKDGLNRLSIVNIGAARSEARMWVVLVFSILVVAWVFYVVYQELRGYVRIRQAFLTSPQHRIRASATTVLVCGIPRKWLTMDALSGLYDVFPGGIKNIWINRNYDDLTTKVDYRTSVATSLESAETNLIKLCRKKYMETQKEKAKQQKQHMSREQRKQERKEEDAAADALAMSPGLSSGRPGAGTGGSGQTALEEIEYHKEQGKPSKTAFGLVTEVGHGIGALGKGIGKLGDRVVGGVDQGLHTAGSNFDRAAKQANTGGLGAGFVEDDSIYNQTPIVPPSSTFSDPHDAPTAPTVEELPETKPHHTHYPGVNSPVPNTGDFNVSPSSERTMGIPEVQNARQSAEKRPISPMGIVEPPNAAKSQKLRKFFGNNDRSIAFPSPQPQVTEEDEFPITSTENPTKDLKSESKPTFMQKLAFWKNDKTEKLSKEDSYSRAVSHEWVDEDEDAKAVWRRYIEPKDRETMRVPVFSPTWCPSLPLVGKKVDSIYWLRRELARLNCEIEADQNDPERFPLMNSAFIQFNNQVAAHMCVQSLNHHIPNRMAPRLVEISPNDVIWDNMSLSWWQRYLRTTIILIICAGLILLYAVPVAFSSLLNNVSTVASLAPWLKWLANLPQWVKGIIQGVLPPALLAIILLLVPIIFRILIKQQGVQTGNLQERGVQTWYFAFLFIQVFLVVTIAGGVLSSIDGWVRNPASVAQTISTNFPQAANYFFSYLTVQALSQGASGILQTGTLLNWFLLAPVLDSTARDKWKRQTQLNYITWGTFYPPFTNFAVIGIIYSVLAPLMLVFMILIFGVFWIVWRYNVLFVFSFKNDTGGLLFPVACNQLFIGIYFLELALIGIFFTQRDENGDANCVPHGVIMIIIMVGSALYQWLLNVDFQPLLEYLPITLEDEAVLRDEAFAKKLESKFGPLNAGDAADDEIAETQDVEDALENKEREEEAEDDAAEAAEQKRIEKHRSTVYTSSAPAEAPLQDQSKKGFRTAVLDADNWRNGAARLRYLADGKPIRGQQDGSQDPESQRTVGDALYGGFADELEDLSPKDRDLLVRYAFQHSAVRARRPIVWIPRDKLGVSDDEISRAREMSGYLSMSNDGTALDSKGRVVFRRSPPDFSNVDLIAL